MKKPLGTKWGLLETIAALLRLVVFERSKFDVWFMDKSFDFSKQHAKRNKDDDEKWPTR
jgi:hypothetical protein